jgi:hypothetical protein
MIRRFPVAGLLLGLSASLAAAQVPAPPTQAAPTPAAGAASDYLFPSGAGLLIFHVLPAKVADFDAVLARLKDALATTTNATRRQQAASWNIYKSTEKPGETVTYLFVFDPALATASYDPLLILQEVLPAQVQPLFDRMKEAVVRVERMGLTKIR